MRIPHKLFFACALALVSSGAASAQVNITTWQADLQHTGNNAGETILTPGNVSSPGNFGFLFSQPLDGQTYGQTLLVSGVSIGGTAHNVVYEATEHCSLYAYDADNNTNGNANSLWHATLLPTGTVPVPQGVVGSGDIGVELGITTTPVIDAATNTIYIVSKVQRTADTTYHQYLYALDLATGLPKTNSSVPNYANPVEISIDNGISFPGSAQDAVNNVIPFNPLREHLRCAMAFYNGVVYLAYASHSDTTPYHGEVIGFDGTSLKMAKKFIATPNSGNSEGGIWQSGASPAVDSAGNMYLAIGNGAWDQTNSTYGTNWGESFLKLPTTGTFNVSYSSPANWFTPNNWATLNNGDLDLGAGGLLLLPDQAGPHPHIMVGGGKGAILYVVDRDNLGGLHTPDNAIQEISEVDGNWLFVTPSYYNGYIYYSSAGGPLTQRKVAYNATDGSYISATPIKSDDVFNNKGSGCFISSNGTANGIVWILYGSGVSVYDAANVSGKPIYKASATLSGNINCQNTKFSLPMVANGKLYYTAYDSSNTGHLFVYGLLPTAVGTPAAPSDAGAAAASSKTITVTWTSHSTNESGFKIKRSSTATGTFTQVGSAGAGITAYTDSGLTPSTAYYYQVVATNANGDSNATNVAGATTFPSYTENGLVAYWSMDETGGSMVKDATANAHHGTINGEAGLATGFINNGVGLHGTGQATSNITVPDTSDGSLRFTASQNFTLSAWVYASALRGSEETIIAKSRNTGNYYGIWINAANQWVFRGPGGDVAGPAVTEGAWTHVAVVQDVAAQYPRKLYVNGVLAGTGTAAQAGDGTGPLWMGQQNITGNFASFPGTLDEVRLYSRALAAGEITNLMSPPVLEAHSSQTHGSAGTFGLTLWPLPAPQVESRKGSTAGQYLLALTFSTPVANVTASLRTPGGNPAVGNVSSVSYDTTHRVVTVALSGVGNAQALNLHLLGIAPGNGTVDIPFNVLWGDVNSDNVVNALDAAIVQNLHTTIVTAASAPYDLNADGTVSGADDSLVSAALGTALGPQTDTNLAFYQPTVALSNNGGNTSNLAVDNNTTDTRWESVQKVDPQWMYVDLGAKCAIHTVVLLWENAAGQDYTIDVSDDASQWNTVKQVTGNSTGGLHPYYNLNASGRYVRMYGTARDTPYGYSLYDFQVIGLSGVGAGVSPAINSASSATGMSGNAFSYQITATNSPTGYTAMGLPSGLNVNPASGLITGVPAQSGTFAVTIGAGNASGSGSAALTINVLAPYSAWQNLWFLTPELANPALSGLTATPGGDGVSNLMKYALNINPKGNAMSGLPVQSTTVLSGQNYLTLTYTKVLAAADLTYTVEVSGDLLTWSSGAGFTASTATNNADGLTQTVVARDLTPQGGTNGGKRFIRLKVSKPSDAQRPTARNTLSRN